jgi:hypothetical protein
MADTRDEMVAKLREKKAREAHEKISSLQGQVSGIASMAGRVDELRRLCHKLFHQCEQQGNDIKLLWAHVRRLQAEPDQAVTNSDNAWIFGLFPPPTE